MLPFPMRHEHEARRGSPDTQLRDTGTKQKLHFVSLKSVVFVSGSAWRVTVLNVDDERPAVSQNCSDDYHSPSTRFFGKANICLPVANYLYQCVLGSCQLCKRKRVPIDLFRRVKKKRVMDYNRQKSL